MTGSILHDKKIQDWIVAVLAALLFLSPWLVGYESSMASWCAWISAVLIAFLALTASFTEAQQWEEWVTAGLGFWLVLAPWLLGFSSDPKVQMVFWPIGILTMIISFWAEWAYRHPPAIHG